MSLPLPASPQSDFVYVPVQSATLPLVMEFLLSIHGGNTPRLQQQEQLATQFVEVFGQGRWTEEMVGRLAHTLTYPLARAMLDMAADAASVEVRFDKVVSATDASLYAVRAQIGAMSKLTIRLFGDRKWPVTIRYNGDGTAKYSMDPVVAGWWKVATGR